MYPYLQVMTCVQILVKKPNVMMYINIVKKSGLMGAGIGFTIGSKEVTDTTDGRYKNQVASNISSSDGSD